MWPFSNYPEHADTPPPTSPPPPPLTEDELTVEGIGESFREAIDKALAEPHVPTWKRPRPRTPWRW